MNKKGQSMSIDSATNSVIVLVVVILIAAMGAVGLGALQSGSDQTSTSTRLDVNTFTALNSTSVYFGDTDVEGAAPVSCVSPTFTNGTAAENITINITVGGAGNCYATLKGVAYNNTALSVNYTLTEKTYTTSYNVSKQGILSFRNFSEQMPTVGTMVGIGIILAVIFGIFVMMKNKE